MQRRRVFMVAAVETRAGPELPVVGVPRGAGALAEPAGEELFFHFVWHDSSQLLSQPEVHPDRRCRIGSTPSRASRDLTCARSKTAGGGFDPGANQALTCRRRPGRWMIVGVECSCNQPRWSRCPESSRAVDALVQPVPVARMQELERQVRQVGRARRPEVVARAFLEQQPRLVEVVLRPVSEQRGERRPGVREGLAVHLAPRGGSRASRLARQADERHFRNDRPACLVRARQCGPPRRRSERSRLAIRLVPRPARSASARSRAGIGRADRGWRRHPRFEPHNSPIASRSRECLHGCGTILTEVWKRRKFVYVASDVPVSATQSNAHASPPEP